MLSSSRMSGIFFFIILTSCLVNCAYSIPEVYQGLSNKHLIVEGEQWYPFLSFDRDENGNTINQKGIMWDLLLFMQKAKNFTFTFVSEADYVWGQCHSMNDSTGMIGMVTRKEVDFALGNHIQTKFSYKLQCSTLYFRSIYAN